MNEEKYLDINVIDNCQNLAESYGEICTKCNKCGRFDEEKRIIETEEMAINMCICCRGNLVSCSDESPCEDVHKHAKALYNMGYRNASDVINEFSSELIKRFNDLEYNADTPRKTVKIDELREQANWILHEVATNTIKEFAEKYVEAMNGNL